MTGGGAIAVLYGVYRVDAAGATPWIALVLTIGLALLAQFELLLMLRRAGFDVARAAGLGLGGLFLAGAARLGVAGSEVPSAALLPLAFVVLCAVEVVRGRVEQGTRRIAHTSMTLLVVACFGSLIDVLLGPAGPRGIELALLIVLTAKGADVGGFLAGKLIGGPKLAPRVSPNKTWAGSLGGVVLSLVVVYAVSAAFDVPLTALEVVGFGVAVNVAAQLGDLTESLWKRACGVKDSSTFLPTFGGFLDMIDSLVLAAPVGYWFLTWRGVL